MEQSQPLKLALAATGAYLLFKALSSQALGRVVEESAKERAVEKLMPGDFRSAFVRKIWLDAEAVAQEAGWPRDLLITVAAHESDWGRSGLTQKGNNLFGFKVNAGWLAEGRPYVELPTREVLDGVAQTVKAKFRAYPTWGDSIRDYVRLVSTLSRYVNANAAAKRKDFAGYFAAIKEGGYATDPLYPEKLARTYGNVQSAFV